MANKKFSEFTLKTDSANVDFLVGFDGTDNVRIAPSNLGGGATSLNGLTDVLIDTASEYVGTVPASLSGNPQGNTFLGINAGTSNTSGANNTNIGRQAGTSNTTNGSRTMVGDEAGAFQTGARCTGIGRYALRQGTGSNNTAVGESAMVGNISSGSFNTAVGQNALSRAGAKSRNIAVGGDAGRLLQTGGNNTLLGYQSGDSLTTGSNNIVIGYQAAASAVDVSNEITLGDSNIATLRCAVTSITSLSDERDKSEIKDLQYGLDFIDSLQPREFVWDNRAEISREYDEEGNAMEVEFYSANKGKKDFGFIAQEVQSVDDDTLRLVYDENPDKLELSYGKLVPILVQAIKDLKAEVELLKG